MKLFLFISVAAVWLSASVALARMPAPICVYPDLALSDSEYYIERSTVFSPDVAFGSGRDVKREQSFYSLVSCAAGYQLRFELTDVALLKGQHIVKQKLEHGGQFTFRELQSDLAETGIDATIQPMPAKLCACMTKER